ncbi:MAG: hypothetical protein R6U32_03645 [Candidatus Woesearchaeota archaeon]
MYFPEGKKGQGLTESNIVRLLLALITIVLLSGFIYLLFTGTTGHEEEKMCRKAILVQQTVAEKTSTAGSAMEYVKPWPSVCKTRDKIIKAKEPEVAMEELSELMWRCWWMMGEGEIKPFDKDWWSGGRKCFVCYTAQFPELEDDIAGTEFTQYLKENGREGESYYGIFRYEEDKIVENPLLDDVDNSRNYAVVYTSPSDITAWKYLFKKSAEVIRGSREDMVYVTDMERGNVGCYGSWFTGGTEVKGSE